MSSFQTSFFSYGEEISSASKNLLSPSHHKPLTGRRLVKEVLRILNMMVKAVFAAGTSSTGVQNIRQGLNLAKQGVTAAKVAKNIFAISQEKKKVPWQTQAYHWINMMQSLVVCTITSASLINPDYNHGKAVVSFCSIVRSGAKFVYQPETSTATLEERRNLSYLKKSKQIVSIAAEAFVFLGLVFSFILLSKTAFLVMSLVAVNLGIAKTFYKRTRTPVDEFPLLA